MITPEAYAKAGTEHAHQVALFIWASQSLKQYPLLRLLHAIPNGGDRAPAVAARMKAEGVKAGVSDIFLPVARHGVHGLYIELKRPKIDGNRPAGTPSDAQLAWIDDVRAQGYGACVCVGWQAARDVLVQYLS